MNSVYHEIEKIRNGEPFTVNRRNKNRYRVDVLGENGVRTAYCFSAPVYSQRNEKLVNLKFQKNSDSWMSFGTTADLMTRENSLILNDSFGFCRITLPDRYIFGTENSIRRGYSEMFPTLNGVAFKTTLGQGREYCIVLEADDPTLTVKANDKAFSLMKDDFTPFVTVSGIGVLDTNNIVVAPLDISYQKRSRKEYGLVIKPKGPFGNIMLFEINLHEPKLLEDTTVERLHPKMNNAFGGTAFLGNTVSFGEQWLYSRINTKYISELTDRKIQSVILHLPKHSKGTVEISAFRPSGRFCSVGSTWSNKVGVGAEISTSFSRPEYQSLAVTELIVDSNTHCLTESEGFILRTKVKNSGFSAVSTGDSCFSPQVLEINF